MHELHKVVNNQPSVAANQSAVEDANVLDWVSLAQNCAIANVNKKVALQWGESQFPDPGP